MKEIIRVENLSKAYRIGQKQQSHDTLFGKMADMVKAPLRNLKKLRSLTRFDGAEDPTVHWALKDIDFTVHEGEVLGIIGHNGAGKSTLLKILSRVTEPTTGRITIHGRVGALLEVGTGFHPELTGRENIYMNGTILGMTKKEIDRKLDEIVDFSGVEKYIDTPVKFYSSGMKVRLGFAVAAHLDPEILIIDEVLAVGDVEFQRKCLGKMEDVSRSGRTVLFVSHNMESVSQLCTKAVLLNHGIIIHSGEVSSAVDIYINNMLQNISLKKGHTKAKSHIEINNVYVLDKNKKATTYIESGSDLVILIEYLNSSKPLRSVDVGVSIHESKSDGLLTLFYTSFNDEVIDLQKGSGQIKIKLNELNLPEGKYFLRIQMMKGVEELYKSDAPLCVINVAAHSFYSSGLPILRRTRVMPKFLIKGKLMSYA